MQLRSKLRGLYLRLYFFFKKKKLFKDGYGLNYYLYRNTRPNSAFDLGVRTDDTTVLYVIDKILSSPNMTTSDEIHCIDVGAYIGIVTLIMSKALKNIKKKWKIHTFEPFEESFAKLQENINLDPASKNICLNQLAISEKSGVSTFKSYENTPGENHLELISSKKNNESSKILKNIKVLCLRDYIIKNHIKKVAICKIDTEGGDYFVIKGLHEFLEYRIVDYFIFEYQVNTYNMIKKILNDNGYTIYLLVRNENYLVNSFKNYPKNCKSVLNCIAVSEEKKIKFLDKLDIIN